MIKKLILAILVCAAFFTPLPAYAYIGPGAGFAFLGSGFVFILTIAMAAVTLLWWPVRFIQRKLSGRGIPSNARTRRVVIVGYDGLDPNLLDRLSAENQLPNFDELAKEGGYRRLGTTLPALSPVAWSTFQTGVNPGAHNIFDFLTRDKRHCLPLLSSTEIETTAAKKLFGKITIWPGKSGIKIMRKSQPFWKILGERGIFSNVLRVPISYPPEKFEGNILSAMCTPDLRGTQGTFSFFTTRPQKLSSTGKVAEGGEIHALKKDGASFVGELLGPPNPQNPRKPLVVQFRVEPRDDHTLLIVGEQKLKLRLNEFSPWTEVEFLAGRKKLPGIVRFCLRELTSEISIYVSPINTHPEKPIFPIAHPIFFSGWLAKCQGLFGTLGLMEDTWGRNELALDDQRFLDQTYLTHDEREKMFFNALEKTKEGLCVCVFDASDRIQHMFWRYLDPKHPSPREDERFADTIPTMYRKMDELLGRIRKKLKPDDVLIVLSDHGFSSFRRGININSWLRQEGYLVLKDDATAGRDYFQDVDWPKTKAFAVGLSGLYLNQKGREFQGIVPPAEVAALKAEICAKLAQVCDPLDGARAIRKVYDTAVEYRGLYTKDAPDMVVGYEPGYRVSWDSVTGAVEAEIFSDNLKAWSGDHHVDPSAVPGVLFSNRKISSATPHIRDLAPSVLDLFAVPVPKYMEGKVIL